MFYTVRTFDDECVMALLTHTIKASVTPFSTVTTDAIDTTGAGAIFIGSYSELTTIFPTDSQSNTWTKDIEVSSAGQRFKLYRCSSPSTSASHTFTLTLIAGGKPSLWVACFSGTNIVLDQTNSNTATGTSIQPGSLTPPLNNALFIASVGLGITSAVSVDSGFTLLDSQTLIGGQRFSLASAYKLQTTAAAENPTWSWTTSATVDALIATYTCS